jgi:protein TonB
VGNTTAGKTAERAVDPKQVVAAPPEAPPEAPPANRAASHIPVAGVKYAQPRQKERVKPVYPETLKAQGIEVDVPVMVKLDTTGKVVEVKILKPTPYPEIDESARQAALAQEWEPALRDGVPIPYTVSYTYKFRLEDQ